MDEIIEEIDLERLDSFENEIATLQKRRLAFLRDVFPEGSVIWFDHNGHAQPGRILSHSNAHWREPEIWVENVKTGTERRVSLLQITTAYRRR
jgi:hypothetical protein